MFSKNKKSNYDFSGKKFEIKIFGTGCAKCDKLEKNVQNIVDKYNIEAVTEHVTDIKEILSAGVISTPGLMINGKLISTSKVLNERELLKKLSESLDV
ncbi:MAG: hypothetical protein CSB16_01530 [Clostridiales bacterium]|nr:MAG: hypothetical protein CSB16_01530 [Clostridiales bacterium]